MPESQAYSPEEVIQTEGLNKGNIKDADLAYIGAEAENQKRDSILNKLDRAIGIVVDGNTSSADASANRVGTEAMVREVERRASQDLINKKISPAAAKAGGNVAGENFSTTQYEYTKDRVREEVQKNLKTDGTRKETYR